jgi:hypothetical protein
MKPTRPKKVAEVQPHSSPGRTFNATHIRMKQNASDEIGFAADGKKPGIQQ